MIDIRLAARHRLGIRAAAWVTAACALGLRQRRIEAIDINHVAEYRARGAVRQCAMASSDSFAARGGWWVVAQVPVLLGAAVLPVVTGQGTLWPQQALAWFGAAIALAGFGLTFAGLFALGSALTPFPRPRANVALRTNGIYAWVRHPVYGGLILGTLGWSLWWLSVTGAAFVLVVFLFFDRKSSREERFLIERYKDYPSYRARVRKLVPGVY